MITNNIVYTIHPGQVIKANGERQYVSMRQLIILYKINPKQCKDINDNRTTDTKGYISKLPDTTIHLYPDSTGQYIVPII